MRERIASRSAPAQDEDLFPVWPENWNAVQVFTHLGTQWNVGSTMERIVFVGLKYEQVEPAFRRLDIPPEEWGYCWRAIQVMERAALPQLNTKK